MIIPARNQSLPRPCIIFGCPGRAVHGNYCERHVQPDLRPPAAARGYDWNWAKVRRSFLDRNRVCLCGAPAIDVHHLNGEPRDNREENLVALCRSCHQKTKGGHHGA